MKFTISGDSLLKVERESGDTTTVEIPNGIRIIEDHALDGYVSATKIKIPDSVKEIGDYAFNNCLHLKEINIPDTVTKIGKAAFQNCKILEYIHIPNIKRIEDNTFSGCGLLTKICFGDNLEYIGYDAFKECFSLTEIFIPYKDLIIENAFLGCTALKRIECKEGCVQYPDKLPQNIALVEPISLQRLYMEAYNKLSSSRETSLIDTAINDLNEFNKRHGYPSDYTTETIPILYQNNVLFDKHTGHIVGLIENNYSKYISFYNQFISRDKTPLLFDYVPHNVNFTWEQVKENGKNKIVDPFADTYDQAIRHVLSIYDNILPRGIHLDFSENDLDDFITRTENAFKDKGFVFVFDKYGKLKNEKVFERLLENALTNDKSIFNVIFEKDIWNENDMSFVYDEEYDEER